MNAILEVALGLLFVFLLFSLLVSVLNEAIFGHLTHLRARVLEDSLHAILSNKAKGFSVFSWISRLFRLKASESTGTPGLTNEMFSKQLLGHPLVQGLAVGRRRCPSYLPAETFADAALGTLLGAGDQASPPSAQVDEVKISMLSDEISRLPDPYARRVLSSVLIGAVDVADARQRLQIWFNNAMERVSGAYKRYTQFWLYVWATVIVVWLNVDTIEIARRLLADATFRGTLAGRAVNFVAQVSATNAIVATGATGSAPVAAPANGTSPQSGQSVLDPNALSAAQLLQEINSLKLPIGWGACTSKAAANSLIGWVITKFPILMVSERGSSTNSAAPSLLSGALAIGAPCPQTPEAWRLKLLGLVLTVAAISQGAPFWFDLLNRVTNLRASGRPPARKEPENR